ncbi:tetratricopeptide repeat protein [Paenibacillus sp. UMB4589-SE434]|uniref:tetratricopeptide repeat protein n=1 Tax=Paenibacillus sp. UMB4589-SE434 TaxID=3046314 RepID=UPI0025514753|nr:tetratricopeptide repeat protein [Paenibacillus sp. UMB4589-SE434]MDK8182191.1 tetratricopeptide repeat protein [Paenibacillus sp. UMB4589-SE434]
MSKLLGFGLLYWLFGNPFIAIIALLIIAYMLERRYVGLSPSFIRPIKRMQRIGKLKQELSANPHNVSLKHELGRLLLERKRYREAREVLEPIQDRMEHSAEYWDDLGTSYVHTDDEEKGIQAILQALDINPRVKYGQPYLRLAALYARTDKDKALEALQELHILHSSSCEAYYRMGLLYEEMGRKDEAKRSWNEAISIYRALPKYMRRKERAWMLRSRYKAMSSS